MNIVLCRMLNEINENIFENYCTKCSLDLSQDKKNVISTYFSLPISQTALFQIIRNFENIFHKSINVS